MRRPNIYRTFTNKTAGFLCSSTHRLILGIMFARVRWAASSGKSGTCRGPAEATASARSSLVRIRVWQSTQRAIFQVASVRMDPGSQL